MNEAPCIDITFAVIDGNLHKKESSSQIFEI